MLWTLVVLPNIGATADASAPLPLPPAAAPPPGEHGDIGDPAAHFDAVGGCLLVAESGGHLVAMAGYRPTAPGDAEILRVRVHPALRRRGIGRTLMTALEDHARAAGFTAAHLDTATNQPEAMAFYTALGYQETSRETRPEWHWTLAYFRKQLHT